MNLKALVILACSLYMVGGAGQKYSRCDQESIAACHTRSISPAGTLLEDVLAGTKNQSQTDYICRTLSVSIDVLKDNACF